MVGATPGQAYVPDGWEVWAPAGQLYQAGDYAGAADRGRELIEQNPQYPTLIYNVACCEALSGRKEDAIEHLRQAIALSERLREYAKGDSDFDAIRDDPEFQKLVGG